MSDNYAGFIASKRDVLTFDGIEYEPHESLFPFQQDLVRWALRRGRSAPWTFRVAAAFSSTPRCRYFRATMTINPGWLSPSSPASEGKNRTSRKPQPVSIDRYSSSR